MRVGRVGSLGARKAAGADPGADTTAPLYVSSTASGVTVVLTYDEALDETSTPATSAFAVGGVAGSPTISAVVVSTTTVTLTLTSTTTFGETVTVSYTAPGSNQLQDAAGNDCVNLTTESVTNNTAYDPAGQGTIAAHWRAEDVAQSDGTTVQNWTDHVNSNVLTQATSSYRPTLRTTGMNSRPALEFDGSVDHLAKSTAGFLNFDYDDPFTICLMLNSDGTPATRVYYMGKGDTNDGWSLESGIATDTKITPRLQEDSGTEEISTETDGAVIGSDTTIFLAMTYSGSNTAAGLKVYTDGTLEAATAVETDTLTLIATGGPFNVGGLSTANSFLGKYAEVLVYSTELSAAQMLSLHDDYFQPRYAL